MNNDAKKKKNYKERFTYEEEQISLKQIKD